MSCVNSHYEKFCAALCSAVDSLLFYIRNISVPIYEPRSNRCKLPRICDGLLRACYQQTYFLRASSVHPKVLNRCSKIQKTVRLLNGISPWKDEIRICFISCGSGRQLSNGANGTQAAC